MLKRFKLKQSVIKATLTISALFLLVFVISCSQDKEPDQKHHEVKNFTVKYDLTGAKKGQMTIYSQDWGRCVAQVTENNKIISLMEDGEQYVVSTDLTKNTGTKMKNPIYKQLLESMEAKTPKEFNMAILEKMGGKVVGEKKIAGNDCKEWDIMNGAQKTCITDDGIILETVSNISGTESGKIATELNRNSTGGIDACDPGEAVIEEIDLSQMMQQQKVERKPQVKEEVIVDKNEKIKEEQKKEEEK